MINVDSNSCFYHTTLAQGLTESFKNLVDYFKNSKNILNYSKTIENIRNWDLFMKEPSFITEDLYNNEINAVIMKYSNSEILGRYSFLILEEMKKANFIYTYKNFPFLDFKDNLNDNYKYALNYYYKVKAFNFCAHTTLGFNKVQKNLNLMSNNLNNIQIKKIHHEGIYISELNKYCMTPYKTRDLILNYDEVNFTQS